MLIEFTVGNFLSFKDPVTLSMVAAKIKARDPKVNENNTIFLNDEMTLLTSAAVYGANASGKSSLVHAIRFMRQYILNSSKNTVTDEPIRTIPFRLSTVTQDQPSFFQISFLLENVKYRYGFEANSKEIVSEWLFVAPSQKETRLFVRDENGIQVGRSFKEGKGLEEKTRPNALFLSVAAQWNGTQATKIMGWFRNLKVISGLSDINYKGFTIRSFEDGSYRQEIINLVRSLDLGIDDINAEKMSDDKYKAFIPDNISPEVREVLVEQAETDKVDIQTAHKIFDASGKPVSSVNFSLQQDESDGTEKLFYMTGPFVDVLSKGSVLVIDELEARLHPLITRTLIGLFNSKETNPKGAQLVFTTHDTNLLSNKTFRRDQIWFTEKDRFGCSHLYSLAELQVRNDASFESDYIDGRYGAVPFLGNVQHVMLEE